MISKAVANWTPRLPMTAPSLVGQYVCTDPLDLTKDVPLLWDALGGNDGSINQRLQWYGLADFDEPTDLENSLTEIEQPEGCCVNIFRVDGKVAGMASFIATAKDHGSTEIGYVAHGAAMARTPAATEAHYLLAQHVFETMKYRRYEWKCDSSNKPSCNAAVRYGFSWEGCFRQHRVTAKGNNRDTNWYSMIDAEWESRKQAMENWLDPSNFDIGGNQKRRLQDFQKLKD